jgi:hypothetical protein
VPTTSWKATRCKSCSISPDEDWPDEDWPDEDWPDEDWPDEDWPDEALASSGKVRVGEIALAAGSIKGKGLFLHAGSKSYRRKGEKIRETFAVSFLSIIVSQSSRAVKRLPDKSRANHESIP